jgi:hypothetical protein
MSRGKFALKKGTILLAIACTVSLFMLKIGAYTPF